MLNKRQNISIFIINLKKDSKKKEYMTQLCKKYNLEYIKQTKASKEYTDEEISSHYSENRTHFKDAEGKILPRESAQTAIVSKLYNL